MSEDTEQNVASASVNEKETSQRNVFDQIGDFFLKMIKGIFAFVFCKIPKKIWEIIRDLERLKRILRYLYSIMRALVLCLVWISLVFFGWWFFLRDQFIAFWKNVWGLFCYIFGSFLEFLWDQSAWIWMILALCGSVYGLAYVTLKKRAKKKKENLSQKDSAGNDNTLR